MRAIARIRIVSIVLLALTGCSTAVAPPGPSGLDGFAVTDTGGIAADTTTATEDSFTADVATSAADIGPADTAPMDAGLVDIVIADVGAPDDITGPVATDSANIDSAAVVGGDACPEGGEPPCVCPSDTKKTCYSGGLGTEGVGICKPGLRACEGDGTWGICQGQTLPAVETCDGLLDEDCDGQTDEGCKCVNDKVQGCYSGGFGTDGVGTCLAGLRFCVKGAWSGCVGEVVPKAETCNAKDDDCDGKTDEQATCPEAGASCVAGVCKSQCAAAGAKACPAGTICSVGDKAPGTCVKPGSGCVVTGTSTKCGAWSCGPGTLCDELAGACVPALPCQTMICANGGCWGNTCPCKRPQPWCKTATLPKLNQNAFTSGLVDLDFDLGCTGWGVTVLNGPDKLRKIPPSGTVKEFVGVSNLDMGEAAALQGFASTFGGNELEVALTYTCCATCGCFLNPPQGVAWLDQNKGTLPMMIPSVKTTKGLGPFGNKLLDSGPQGLTWGLGTQLYVGNVDSNGDFHALDLQTKKKTKLTTLPARVYAATPFDGVRLVVALENKQLVLLHIGDGKTKPLATVKQPVTSLARDPFSGHIYVSFKGGEIRTLSGTGTDLGTFAKAAGSGRLSLAGDNHLYHLTAGPVSKAKVERFPLPSGF